MATCNFLGSIYKSDACRQAGGIIALYIMSSQDPNFALTKDFGGKHIIYGIRGAGPITLHKFETALNTGSTSETSATNEDTGTFEITQTVTATTLGITSDKVDTLRSLLGGCKVWVQIADGTTWLYGEENEMTVDISLESGEATADSSKATITLTGLEYDLASVVNLSTREEPFGIFTEGTDYVIA